MWSEVLVSEWSIASLLLIASITRLWYAVPLIVAISLVYGATRHELMRPILQHAWHFAVWMLGFMVVLFGVLWLVSRWL